MNDQHFGGLSAIEVSSDGQAFTALSDKGGYVQGQFIRDKAGIITGIEAGAVRFLQSDKGTAWPHKLSDSEGLAIGKDGAIYVSFEGVARVERYDRIDGLPERLPVPKAFKAFSSNAAFEALAIDPAGDLFTLPEELPEAKKMRLLIGQPGNANGPDFPVWRFAKGKWVQPYTLPRRGSYLPVGADFGPDGRLYLLERQFLGLKGFSSRVRSFKVYAKGLQDERIVMQTPIGLHDNLEGLSVWRDELGDIRLTMVSDDNFLPILRTEVVEYRVTD